MSHAVIERHGRRRWRRLRTRGQAAGMTTSEYAVGTLAACTFAAVMIAIVRSDGVQAALTNLVTTALAIAS